MNSVVSNIDASGISRAHLRRRAAAAAQGALPPAWSCSAPGRPIPRLPAARLRSRCRRRRRRRRRAACPLVARSLPVGPAQESGASLISRECGLASHKSKSRRRRLCHPAASPLAARSPQANPSVRMVKQALFDCKRCRLDWPYQDEHISGVTFGAIRNAPSSYMNAAAFM